MIRRWIIGVPAGLMVAVSLMAAVGAVGPKALPPTSPPEVTLDVSGLPADKELTIWAAAKDDRAGYRYIGELATVTGPGVYTLALPPGTEAIDVPPVYESVPMVMPPEKVRQGLPPTYELDHTRYSSPSRFYDLEARPATLGITITRQYRVQFASGSRSLKHPGAALPGESQIRVTPDGDADFFDEGSVITVEAIPGHGVMFAYWVIKDATLPIKIERDDFTTALNPVEIEVTGPMAVSASFVSEWFRSPEKAKPEWFDDFRMQSADTTIYVRGLTSGQRVRLVEGDDITGEALVGDGQTTAAIPVPRNTIVRGVFQITAPDGVTVIFQSPAYEDLSAGDVFDY